MPSLSLKYKIALVLVLPLTLALPAVVELSFRRAQVVIRQNAVEEAAALADLVATSFSLAETPAPGAAGGVHRQVGAAMQSDTRLFEDVSALRVVDGKGVVRWSRRVEEVGQRHEEGTRLLSAPPQGQTDVGRGEYVRPLGGMGCARCHASGDAFRVGAVQAVIAKPRVEDDLNGFYRGVLAFLVGLLAVVVAATFVLLHLLITGPLGRLTESMQRAEKGDFLVRAKVETADEIGRLASAFNSMVSRITEMKVAEIETSREMESMQRELALKAELERQNGVIEEANRALARRVREVTLLLDITRSLNSSLALPEILHLVTEMVGVTVGVDQFAVMLLDESGKALQVAASFGFRQDDLADFRLALGTGASGMAAQSRETLYIADTRTDPRYVPGPQDPPGEGSMLAVPLVSKERLVGVFNFVRFKKDGFSENDIVLLSLVGSQAAMAILNAHLYSETLELSLTDALTGLFNRRKLLSRLEMEIVRSQRFGAGFSVLMIDIDHFKTLNDTCGHPAGDVVLRQVAELLKNSVRRVDTVARWGGEEFMILLPKCDVAEATDVAEKLRRGIERLDFPFAAQQPGGRVTISLGLATFPDDGETMERLLDAVDAALYASKRGGRNRTTRYEPGMEMHPGRQRGPKAELTPPAR